MPNSDSEGRVTALAKRLPDDLRNTEAVRAFISEPLQTAVALMTAALASGHEQMILAGGHVAQAMLKGRAGRGQIARRQSDVRCGQLAAGSRRRGGHALPALSSSC